MNADWNNDDMNDALAQLISRWRTTRVGPTARGSCGSSGSRTCSIRAGIAEVVRDRCGHVRQRLQGLIAGDGCSFDRRATADLQGADHAFLWKPKPASPTSTRARTTSGPRAVPARLLVLRKRGGRGAGDPPTRRLRHQGPRSRRGQHAHFLHPTLVPPFNTAIVKGTTLTGSKVKLGRGRSTSPCGRACSASMPSTEQC